MAVLIGHALIVVVCVLLAIWPHAWAPEPMCRVAFWLLARGRLRFAYVAGGHHWAPRGQAWCGRWLVAEWHTIDGAEAERHRPESALAHLQTQFRAAMRLKKENAA